MARKKSAPKSKHTGSLFNAEFRNIIAGGILITLSVLVFFATSETTAQGEAPIIGKYLSAWGEALFGSYYRYIFCPITAILGIMIIARRAEWTLWRCMGLILFMISVSSIHGNITHTPAGFFDISGSLIRIIGNTSTSIFLVVLTLSSLYLALRISYRNIIAQVRKSVPSLSTLKNAKEALLPGEDIADIVPKRGKIDAVQQQKADAIEERLAHIQKQKAPEPPKEKPAPPGKAVLQKLFSGSAGEKNIPIHHADGTVIEKKPSQKQTIDFGTWDFPSTQLLNTIEHQNPISPAEVEEKSLIIQKTFLQFGIDVTMKEQCIGPTVIQYRLEPSEGVHLTKLKNLKDNLTLALKAKSIRVQAPIPGMGLVGIEVPNEKRDIVSIKEVFESKAFTAAKSPLSLALGKDINGDYIVGDLGKMPHLLIAGQTGSGKSVGMNGFILSLLYKNTPSELRMIMVDPKQVELGIYDGIPHLLAPVIHTPDKALNALKWAVAEMERRYGTLKPTRARNLAEYNAKVGDKEKMYAIVVIIDELADLMMSGNKKEVESAITRIAQKARAVGIHLIVATQRPSVDVITGLIKANIPSRVAFTVAQGVDSKTILDTVGAEDLLGRGDMLYHPTGAMASTRIQGVLVNTDEVERVVNHIKRTIDPAMLEDIYDASIVEGDRGNFEGSASGGGYGDEDPKVIEEAIELVRSAGKCSTSMLQRHLKLGYGRAARVVDTLEQLGIVGPADGSKPREVL